MLIASTSSPVHPRLQTYRGVAANRRFGLRTETTAHQTPLRQYLRNPVRQQSREPNTRARVSPLNGGECMRSKTDAIEHCQRHIERARAEIARREALGHDAEPHRKRVKTLEALRAVHEAARNQSDAA